MKVFFEGNGKEITGVKFELSGNLDEYSGGDSAGDMTKFVIRSGNIDSKGSFVEFLDTNKDKLGIALGETKKPNAK